jgi:dTDP-4-dehydrorhamnose 3,5-epimerase
MKLLNIRSLEIPAVKVVRFGRFRDERGYFTEPFRLSELTTQLKGMEDGFVQSNESFSRIHTLRGLHFQWNPYMGKLVRTLSGRMVDLFLDICKGSSTYGKISAYAMPYDRQADFAEWIWIPPGFAHGNFFSEDSTIEYFCSGEYSPECEAGISPLAKDLDWSLCPKELKAEFEAIAKRAIISEKDKKAFTLSQWNEDPRSENFLYEQLTGVGPL